MIRFCGGSMDHQINPIEVIRRMAAMNGKPSATQTHACRPITLITSTDNRADALQQRSQRADACSTNSDEMDMTTTETISDHG
jgi:hypothetical protein